MKFFREKSPFREPPQKNPSMSQILQEIPSQPGKVIREINDKKLKELWETRDLLELAIQGNKLLEQLRTEYHIPLSARFVVGQNERGEKVIYIVSDKIIGEEVSNMFSIIDTERERFGQEAEQIGKSLTLYLVDAYDTGKPFLWDVFAPRQYMWGHKENQEENHMYLIDVEPRIYTFNEVGIRAFSDLVSAVERFEIKSKIDFSRVWKILDNFYKKVVSDTKTIQEENMPRTLVKSELDFIKKILGRHLVSAAL
jgi:hypothetical protein